MSKLHVFEFGGKKFVSGLFWQVLTSQTGSQTESRSLAKQLKFDFMIVRTGTLPQAGFCSREDGAVAGAGSLAAVVSKTMDMERSGSNWMVAFLLPDGMFAYVAMRDNGFLANGDMAGTKEEVIEKMTSDLPLGAWDRIVAPDEFGMPNSVFRPMLSFLPMKNGEVRFLKWWQIKAVNSEMAISKKLIAVGISAMLVLAGAGGLYYQNIRNDEARAAEEAEKARLALAQQMRKPATREVKAWSQLPLFQDLFEACDLVIKSSPELAAGWRRTSADCSVGGSEVSYMRNELGTTASFLRLFPNGSSVDMSGNSGKVFERYAFDYSDAEDLMQGDDLIVALQSRFQEIGIELQLSEHLDRKALPGAAPAVFADSIKVFNFRFNDKRGPHAFVRLLDMPGLRVTKLGNKNMTDWSYEGVLYAK